MNSTCDSNAYTVILYQLIKKIHNITYVYTPEIYNALSKVMDAYIDHVYYIVCMHILYESDQTSLIIEQAKAQSSKSYAGI